MKYTRKDIYTGPASGLGYAHLGANVMLASGGIQYEGILTYLSFDNTRGEDEKVAVALAVDEDPVNDIVFYLTADHYVTTQHDTEVKA